MKRMILLLVGLFLRAGAAGEIMDAPPASPDATTRYIIYLHGAIVTGSNGRPVSEHFGVYEYRAILERLAASGATVISEIRQDDTDEAAHVRRVASWIGQLRQKGVPARQITIIGASLGGIIAAQVSHTVPERDLGYVLLASAYRIQSVQPFSLHGRVLTIHDEADDRTWVAREYFDRSPDLAASRTIITRTGLGHALLYTPQDAWVLPALDWIKSGPQ